MQRINSQKPFPKTTAKIAKIKRKRKLPDVNGYYSFLGLPSDASDLEIHSRYRELAKKYHPDAGGTVEDFVFLKTIIEVLLDPVERMIYDTIKNGVYLTKHEVKKNAIYKQEEEELQLHQDKSILAYSYYTTIPKFNEETVGEWVRLLIESAIEIGLETELRLVMGNEIAVKGGALGRFLIYVNNKPSKQTAKILMLKIAKEIKNG